MTDTNDIVHTNLNIHKSKQPFTKQEEKKLSLK